MATARDIVTNALRRLRAYSAGETVSAEDMDDGVSTLNSMLFAWENDGVPLGHTTVTAADDVNVPDSFLRCVQLNLAAELQGQFGLQLSATDTVQADVDLRALRAAYYDAEDLGVDTALLTRRQTFNFATG